MLKEGASKSNLGIMGFNRFNFAREESVETTNRNNQEKPKIQSTRKEKLEPVSSRTVTTTESQAIQSSIFDFLEIKREIIEKCLFHPCPKQFNDPTEALEYFDSRFRMLRTVLQRTKMYLGFSAGHLEELKELFVLVASAESGMLSLLKRNGIPVDLVIVKTQELEWLARFRQILEKQLMHRISGLMVDQKENAKIDYEIRKKISRQLFSEAEKRRMGRLCMSLDYLFGSPASFHSFSITFYKIDYVTGTMLTNPQTIFPMKIEHDRRAAFIGEILTVQPDEDLHAALVFELQIQKNSRGDEMIRQGWTLIPTREADLEMMLAAAKQARDAQLFTDLTNQVEEGPKHSKFKPTIQYSGSEVQNETEPKDESSDEELFLGMDKHGFLKNQVKRPSKERIFKGSTSGTESSEFLELESSKLIFNRKEEKRIFHDKERQDIIDPYNIRNWPESTGKFKLPFYKYPLNLKTSLEALKYNDRIGDNFLYIQLTKASEGESVIIFEHHHRRFCHLSYIVPSVHRDRDHEAQKEEISKLKDANKIARDEIMRLSSLFEAHKKKYQEMTLLENDQVSKLLAEEKRILDALRKNPFSQD